MTPKINIRIDKRGLFHVDVTGAQGLSCQELTRALEEALGTKVEVQQKPEYYTQIDGIENYVQTDE